MKNQIVKKETEEYARKVQGDDHFSSYQRIGNGSACSCKRGFLPTLFCYVGLLYSAWENNSPNKQKFGDY